MYPTVVISLRTLAAYRQSHHTCPCFGIQAQCKTLAFLHDIPYHPYLNMQFSVAYDIYLEILHCVQQHLQAPLGHDTPNWHLLNSCPACFYKLRDEPKLEFDWLISIDGNNSLKRWDSTIYGNTPHVDSRWARSDYWVEPKAVDWFQNAVRAHDVIFDESGIFITACRHCFVLVACDMLRSSELAKYPLVLIDKLLGVYGPNRSCAYDIGCVFSKTLSSSSLVSQLHWHPLYIPGTGHSEGEGCKHIFSASNKLARSTRYVSPFHRHQSIKEHFSFWDKDKYVALSNFLWNHYREALKVIATLTIELTIIKAELQLTDDNFPRFLHEECNYLESLKELPMNLLNEGNSLMQINQALMAAHIKVDSSYAKLQHMEALVAHMEIQLSIDVWWEIGGKEYNRFKDEASLSKYCMALDELEQLVIMRLFELSKLSLSGTGYKLWQQISKALQWHSETIRKDITRYNVQAAALNPPHPNISWKDIADYSFIAEFDLLRHSRAGIRSNDWAKPAHREATTKYFKLLRAREEIDRLNIEFRRLHTVIHDEELQVAGIIHDLLISDPLLGCELKCQWHS
ncbi:hypothetical protein EDB19DRAFT_1897395 [Suillus lakei]|nr:hypothetical protein EDB19DRAFT_1897395 [Suillus lakei]